MTSSAFMRGRRAGLQFALIMVALACTVSGARSSYAAQPQPPTPIRMVQTPAGPVKVYDLNQIRAYPGVSLVRAQSNTSRRPVGRSAVAVGDGSEYLSYAATDQAQETTYAGESIYWYFDQYGDFICGFMVGQGYTEPGYAYVGEAGDLYIDATLVAGTDSNSPGPTGYTSDESACVSGLAGSTWYAYVDVYAQFVTTGDYGYADASGYATQP